MDLRANVTRDVTGRIRKLIKQWKFGLITTDHARNLISDDVARLQRIWIPERKEGIKE